MSGAAAVGAAVGDAALMGKLIPGRLAGGRAAEVVDGGPTVPHCEKCANTFFRYGHFWSSGKWNPPVDTEAPAEALRPERRCCR